MRHNLSAVIAPALPFKHGCVSVPLSYGWVCIRIYDWEQNVQECTFKSLHLKSHSSLRRCRCSWNQPEWSALKGMTWGVRQVTPLCMPWHKTSRANLKRRLTLLPYKKHWSHDSFSHGSRLLEWKSCCEWTMKEMPKQCRQTPFSLRLCFLYHFYLISTSARWQKKNKCTNSAFFWKDTHLTP